MEISDKKSFMEMLAMTLASYGKQMPEGVFLSSWWEELKQFPVQAVRMAFVAYKSENGEFAPVPAGIAKRCKLMDGRPADDEAWAIAITSRDEAETVVWTTEIAEAFSVCSSILDLGDEVGARMAFKDAYNRIVSESRLVGKPASWFPSLGWDANKRDVAINRAHVAGLIGAPQVKALLPNYMETEDKTNAPAGLQMVKDAMAEMAMLNAVQNQKWEDERIAQREAEAQKKRDIAEQVSNYGNGPH
jgi:hypothetical protein